MNSIFSLTLLFFGLLFLLAWPLGRYLATQAGSGYRCLIPVEAMLLRLIGTRHEDGMNWRGYGIALLMFNVLGVLAVYALQRLQGFLPLNPDQMGAVEPLSAFNTAISFVTNTNWQGYGGESTMSHLTQMLALSVQNFVSAATGLAVAFALMRAFSRQSVVDIGNFWVDLLRGVIWILLPLSILVSLLLVSQGVIQNFSASTEIHTLEGARQWIAQGPVASQEAIKLLGTNGGGFFNANSAHPYENPTALSNLVEMLSIFLLPAALCFAFGRMLKDSRQGMVILGAMTLMFLLMLTLAYQSEAAGNVLLGNMGVDMQAGNMEGKELRFGIPGSTLFATVTTAASCGAVNAMHDSFTALGGLAPMWLMQLGEVVFGGIGAGFYGMMMFALMAVFIAGLMIGRTPEYQGKKIGSFDIKMASLVVLMSPLLVLGGTAFAMLAPQGLAGMSNPGMHGFSEVLYAFSSAANNNGSAFAGLSANTDFYNIMLALAMWFGRFAIIIPVLAVAGSISAKPVIPASSGTLSTRSLQFMLLLAGTVLAVGALTFLPALAMGPIAEHLQFFAR